VEPLAQGRPHIELYLRWLQEVRRYRPSTVSRRMSVVAGFYRTCVIDAVLEHSPAEYVRRPNVPAESPTLGSTHLHFEALLTTAKHSPNRCDFALVTMLGLLGLRIFEATGSNIEDRTSGPILLASRGTRMDRHCATRRLRRHAEHAEVKLPRMHPHMLRHTFVTTMLDAGVDLRDVQIAARHADPRSTMRYDRARKNLDRHPNCILAAYMASGT
jgi:integrase/recombinase XerD